MRLRSQSQAPGGGFRRRVPRRPRRLSQACRRQAAETISMAAAPAAEVDRERQIAAIPRRLTTAVGAEMWRARPRLSRRRPVRRRRGLEEDRGAAVLAWL